MSIFFDKHGCYNRDIKNYYKGRGGYIFTQDINFIQIKNIMSKHCVYTIENLDDKKCIGCKHYNNTPPS